MLLCSLWPSVALYAHGSPCATVLPMPLRPSMRSLVPLCSCAHSAQYGPCAFVRTVLLCRYSTQTKGPCALVRTVLTMLMVLPMPLCLYVHMAPVLLWPLMAPVTLCPIFPLDKRTPCAGVRTRQKDPLCSCAAVPLRPSVAHCSLVPLCSHVLPCATVLPMPLGPLMASVPIFHPDKRPPVRLCAQCSIWPLFQYST